MAAGHARGLYDPRFEHDSCGFGLIAQIDSRPSRWLVDTALAALARLNHRGAVAADGISGDGCGVLLYRPEAYLRAVGEACGFRLGPGFSAGHVFLPRDDDRALHCRRVLEEELARVEVRVAGWRALPVRDEVCGETARATLQQVMQVFVCPGPAMDTPGFDRALFLARRRAERRLRDENGFYVISLAACTLGFKGMVTPEHLPEFYPDLARDDLASCAVLFHQRFSTNTAPQWRLAQPFRLLAHNGEINTIQGNRNWMQARSAKWRSPLVDLRDIGPLVSMDGSDSESLDNALEVMLAGGMDLLQALRILIPPAAHSLEHLDPDLAAFYEYYALHSEPWDGPAGIVFCDGRYAGCTLDRNGLRPARWLLSADNHFAVASEAGVWDCPVERIVARGRLGPGEMMAVDFHRGELLDSATIDRINARRAPYKRWLKAGVAYISTDLIDPALAAEPMDPDTLARFQKRFQLTREEREAVLRVLAETEAEAVGSMGDDIPPAVLSHKVRPLYDHFRQAFAQVTNPPIDPLREGLVMSLATQIGREGNIFESSPGNARQILLNSPVLSQRKLRQILAMQDFIHAHARLELYFTREEGLENAIRRLQREAEKAVREGCSVLLLSDRFPPAEDMLAVHALLATGAVHRHLVETGLRCDCNLIVETGTARDPHHFACLIGFGATAVYPYLAYQTLYDMGRAGLIRGHDGEPSELGRSYRRGIRKGLLKILSKMGISTIASYRGAQLFEIVGLADEVVDLCFRHTPSRIGGAGFAELEEDAASLARMAADRVAPIDPGGLLRYVHGGEYHMYNPEVVQGLQRAVRSGDWEDWLAYARKVNGRPPSALRDLLVPRPLGPPVPLEEVEPASAILRRFDSAGMSLGALSPEAHEALAVAMNRLGGRSNSGEGGEDPARYGTEKSSKIKQIASGRFGVTPEYLMHAEVLQIKIAQGAKPGEGGQLPGHKVNPLIARLRHARPGIGLISPPPHHDIYSIEDLAQLIFDLKQINPEALVSVKLVSHAGVGTIAAGVAKCYADLITISGHDGGTGASPVSSIRYAGTPWELGLSEAHQTLRLNGLRDKVRLQVDGGLKTGLDVIKGALLGAESFGFGTAPMIALGCKYLRICHLNNCATGVATQDERLREAHFQGLPERAMNFFRLLAEEVRHELARLGARSLDELIGRSDLLEFRPGPSRRQQRLDLAPLLANAQLASASANRCTVACNPPRDPGALNARLREDLRAAIAEGRGGSFRYAIRNHDRSVGAGVSGEIARRWGNLGMAGNPITVHFTGSAGQSFGAWNAGGLHLYLEGDANDGVGKGMAGGRIVLRAPAGARFDTREAAIMGNACLYGATGGELFAAGRAGERFAVRNSGATAVVEGAGDHCCEYMTGGVVAVLGRTGLNFGAGLTGGFAYVLDLERDFVDRYNHELVDITRMKPEGMEHHLQHLRHLLSRHHEETGSAWSRTLLEEFRDFVGKFWLVKPKAASLHSLMDALRRAA
ncbi:MAG: glutamate synthase large subunit [Lysobacteraceae bacterium]|nr:MAG: glutamate synthase large subunit [Xanthomonadaceae bacterium]